MVYALTLKFLTNDLVGSNPTVFDNFETSSLPFALGKYDP